MCVWQDFQRCSHGFENWYQYETPQHSNLSGQSNALKPSVGIDQHFCPQWWASYNSPNFSPYGTPSCMMTHQQLLKYTKPCSKSLSLKSSQDSLDTFGWMYDMDASSPKHPFKLLIVTGSFLISFQLLFNFWVHFPAMLDHQKFQERMSNCPRCTKPTQRVRALVDISDISDVCRSKSCCGRIYGFESHLQVHIRAKPKSMVYSIV